MLPVTPTWENWSGSVRCTPRAIEAPASESELQSRVRTLAKEGRTARVVGSGHSFTPLAATDDLLMRLDRLSGLERVDGPLATFQAGTKLKAVGDALFAHGLAQENLGDINVQSIAGAVSTGTHGTGAGLGTIATQIAELTLVTGTGEVLTCSEAHEPELFKAAQVSLGALGVVTRVTLRCVPAYKLRLDKGKATLDEVLRDLDRLKGENRHFEFFWFPQADMVQTKRLNPTDEPPTEGGLAKAFNDVVLENGLFLAMCEASRLAPPLTGQLSRLTAAALPEGAEVDWSHRLFSTVRLVKFQEMEYNVPAEKAAEVLTEIRAMLRKQDFGVYFPIEVRFVKGDDIWMSPTYGRDACYIAVHVYRGMAHGPYFQAIEAIFKRHGGRPHWGKLHTLTAGELRAIYPMYDRFLAVRRTLDPHGVFLSDYLQTLLA